MSIEHGGNLGVCERSERIELACGEAQAAIVVVDAVAAEPRERAVGGEHELGERDREDRLEREQRHGEGVHRPAILGRVQRTLERRHERVPVEVGVGEPRLAHGFRHACSPESTTTPSTVAATPANCTRRSRSPSKKKPSTPATTANRLESTAGTATLPLPTPTMNDT